MLRHVYEPVDIAIVGAGPIGLSAAAELRAQGFRLRQFDRGCIGNTIAWFPLGMRFFSSPDRLELNGVPLPHDGAKPSREDYLAYLRAFTNHYDLKVNTYEEVIRVEGSKGSFRLTTRRRDGREFECSCKRLVLAVGSTERPRLLGIPGEDFPHVSHYYRDPHRYFGQRVVIVGGRNSACDAAIQLSRMGVEVTLVHRRPEIPSASIKYWIYPELADKLRRDVIHSRMDSVVEAIEPEAVVVVRRDGTRRERLACDAVLLLVGYEPDFTLLEQLEIPTVGELRRPDVNHETLETAVPGVYCCGTILGGIQNPYAVFIENARHHPVMLARALVRELRPGEPFEARTPVHHPPTETGHEE